MSEVYLDEKNLSKYKSYYIASNKDIESYTALELFMFKSMLSQGNDNYTQYVLKKSRPSTVNIRLVIYGLIDYYNTHKETEMSFDKFKSFFLLNRRYTQYLPIIYYSFDIRDEKIIKDAIINHRHNIDIDYQPKNFTDNVIPFDVGLYKKDKLFPSRYRINSTAILVTLFKLNRFMLNIFDCSREERQPVNKLLRVDKKKEFYLYFKLSRNFFKIRDMYMKEHILL